MACRARWLARCCSPAPIAWETRTVAPISIADKIEMMKKTISNPAADPSNGRRAQASHHERVDGADRRLQQVFADDRCRQREHAALRHRLRRERSGERGELWEETGRRWSLGGLERYVDCGFHPPPRRLCRSTQARRRIPDPNR